MGCTGPVILVAPKISQSLSNYSRKQDTCDNEDVGSGRLEVGIDGIGGGSSDLFRGSEGWNSCSLFVIFSFGKGLG